MSWLLSNSARRVKIVPEETTARQIIGACYRTGLRYGAPRKPAGRLPNSAGIYRSVYKCEQRFGTQHLGRVGAVCAIAPALDPIYNLNLPGRFRAITERHGQSWQTLPRQLDDVILTHFRIKSFNLIEHLLSKQPPN